MKRTNIPVYIDLLFCLVIMPPIIMLVPVDKWIVHHTVFMLTLIVYLYGLYFIYRKVKLPMLFMQRKFGHILLLMLSLIFITWLLTHFPYPPEPNHIDPMMHKARQHMRAQTVWFFFLVVTGFSLSIELIFELVRQILSKQEIEAEKNKAELALYKAQINPHFLFNTLNALYGLVLTKSDKTESAFIKFSNILKYMYAQTTSDLISISNEVEYIRQYVDLQSLRLNKHTKVVFETEMDDEQYGVSSDTDCTIFIRIIVKEGQLIFETENMIMKENHQNPHAIGIDNCRKRLELLYPNRFVLLTKEENGYFKTYLNIQLR